MSRSCDGETSLGGSAATTHGSVARSPCPANRSAVEDRVVQLFTLGCRLCVGEGYEPKASGATGLTFRGALASVTSPHCAK